MKYQTISLVSKSCLRLASVAPQFIRMMTVFSDTSSPELTHSVNLYQIRCCLYILRSKWYHFGFSLENFNSGSLWAGRKGNYEGSFCCAGSHYSCLVGLLSICIFFATKFYKGQLISKCLYEVIIWTKIPTKILVQMMIS